MTTNLTLPEIVDVVSEIIPVDDVDIDKITLEVYLARLGVPVSDVGSLDLSQQKWLWRFFILYPPPAKLDLMMETVASHYLKIYLDHIAHSSQDSQLEQDIRELDDVIHVLQQDTHTNLANTVKRVQARLILLR